MRAPSAVSVRFTNRISLSKAFCWLEVKTISVGITLLIIATKVKEITVQKKNCAFFLSTNHCLPLAENRSGEEWGTLCGERTSGFHEGEVGRGAEKAEAALAGKGVELGVGTVAGEVREGHVTAFSKSLISVFSYTLVHELPQMLELLLDKPCITAISIHGCTRLYTVLGHFMCLNGGKMWLFCVR